MPIPSPACCSGSSLPVCQATFFEIHIADRQEPRLRTAQPAFKQEPEKDRHDEMPPGTFRTKMACICLCKETHQLVLRIDIRYILESGRIIIIRQEICPMPGAVQIFCELPDDRGAG